MNLEKQVEDFLNEHISSEKPFLLGLSGGADSMALFHVLLNLKSLGKLDFAVAHVDHNWRETSSFEAAKLKERVEEAGLVFHLEELDPKKLTGNLEEACRKKRLIFFKHLIETFDYQGVFLAHHLGDQSETVLKRIFEGSFLPRLQGLQPVKRIDGMLIFRPLLKVAKADIEKWLNERGLPFFDDPTNRDPTFMRARFRQKLIPFLSETFGKEIEQPLYRLGIQSFELDEYLKKAFSSHLEKIVKDSFKSSLTFSDSLLPFEVKYLIRLFAESQGISLTYPLIETIKHLIESNASNKQVEIGGKKLFVNRKTLSYLKRRI